ncbi:MAG: biotin/lipoyl-containing protein [Bacillota bacterium]
MKTITSSMAGLILEILVKAGDQIEEGDDAVYLESMKMEVPVQASTSGVVKEIKVKVGDFVNEGDPLIVLE